MSDWPLWEVFVRTKGGLAHRHFGSVHAPDAEMALRHARDMFASITTPRAFLQTQDPEMVGAIIQACSRIALSRTQALQELHRSLV